MLSIIKKFKILYHANINNDKTVYLLIIIFALILFIILKNSHFNSDDWSLLNSARKNPFPYKSDWVMGSDFYYRPLIILSFYLNYLIAGSAPLIYYSFNILIHTFNTFLIIILFKKINQLYENNLDISNIYFIGVVFFLLPQNLYNVFWISGRTDLLCFFFLSISFYTSLRIISKKKICVVYYVIFSVVLILSFRD